MGCSSVTLVSETNIVPEYASDSRSYKLTVSDLPMLSCGYIQKGILLPEPLASSDSVLQNLRSSLSRTLTYFPVLAGRLRTDSDGFVHADCIDSGVPFIHALAPYVSVRDVTGHGDTPEFVRLFFALDGAVSYDGHYCPLAAVKVTELADGVFIGATLNHSVADGTSFWNFFNMWAEISRGESGATPLPDMRRLFVKDSLAVLQFNGCSPPKPPAIRERIFKFSRAAMLQLKARANYGAAEMEMMGKEINDSSCLKIKVTTDGGAGGYPKVKFGISSFQSLCAQWWKSVTRARRNLPATTITTFRMAVNCRHRLEPPLCATYFGNAIQSTPTTATVGEVISKGLPWAAGKINRSVAAHGDKTIRKRVEEWEEAPKVFPLGNANGAAITMGSSAWFPMYDNDFGWGRPLAIRSGRSNKFDGKMSAFPGRDGSGSVDVEVCLAAETMSRLENDPEFMQYVTVD